MNAAEVRKSIEEFSRHLSESTGGGQRTIMAYVSDVKSFARYLEYAARDDERLEDGDTIRSFVVWLKEQQGNGPATIRRKVVALSRYFRWRVRHGLSTSSPMDEAEIVVRLPKRLPRALARDDVALLLRSSNQNSKARGRSGAPAHAEVNLALRLLLVTGIRIGEMCSIAVGDIAPDGSAIRINGKGDRERTVFVGNSSLRGEIARLATVRGAAAGQTSALFLNRKYRSLTPQAFRLRLHRLATQRGMDGPITPHRLRHTAATLLIEEGVDIRFVQRLLGHASIATTEIYTKVVDNSLRAALERADPLRRLQQ